MTNALKVPYVYPTFAILLLYFCYTFAIFPLNFRYTFVPLSYHFRTPHDPREKNFNIFNLSQSYIFFNAGPGRDCDCGKKTMRYIHDPPNTAKNMLALAQSALGVAKRGKTSHEIRFQTLITLCQQAMEQSLKALLIQNDIGYPKDHSLTELSEYIEKKGIVLPESIKISAGSTVLEGGCTFPLEFPIIVGTARPLSEYAGDRRYSFSLEGEPDEEEFLNVLKRTEKVVSWVENQIIGKEKLTGGDSRVVEGGSK